MLLLLSLAFFDEVRTEGLEELFGGPKLVRDNDDRPSKYDAQLCSVRH